jgi:hypothetical protein
VWEQTFEGVPVTFVHYALDSSGRAFKKIVPEPNELVFD